MPVSVRLPANVKAAAEAAAKSDTGSLSSYIGADRSPPQGWISKEVGRRLEAEEMSAAPIDTTLKVGDRVRLVADTLAWRAEKVLRGKVGEVVECRDVGAAGIKRVAVRFPNGRLLMNRDVESFERVKIWLKAKGK